VQIKLADEGLYAGKVDGTWGPDTSAALSNYQRNHSLEVTGKLNAQTLDAMNARIHRVRPRIRLGRTRP
jgi:N-acetylmuramoyl-L-alanine amidase